MIEDRIAEIERRIQNANSVDETNKSELLKLLNSLKAEIAGLSKTHAPQAQSIAQLTGTSTAEVTRDSRNPQLIQKSINDLAASVTEFEKSHPTLVDVVNRICVTLSNLGI